MGRFSDRDPEFASVLKPIVPCDLKFHYRNKMEFSFGAQRWIPGDPLTNDQDQIESGYTLGLHAPRLFDKVLHIEKCLFQSEAATKLFKIVGGIQILASLYMMSTLILDFLNISC